MSDKVYGIDLGTTYSAVAAINQVGLPEIQKNFEGNDTTPSVIYFESADNVVIGAQAKATQASEPDNTCALIKRHMGEAYTVSYQGQDFTPESLSALILKELVHNANEQSGEDITKAVITVPAYFGVQERQATRQAGEIAGLEVVDIIPEPVAAAISLSAQEQEGATFLVFDLGGGTFDTTVMVAKQGSVDVIAIDGNRTLGGADWDERLLGLFLEKFKAQAGLDDDNDPAYDEEFMIDLKVQVEDAKKQLSRRASITLLLTFDGTKEKVEVTREEFEKATADLVAQTIEITERVIMTAQEKVPGLTVDHLMLVGGSSRMPMIEAALTAKGFNPEKTDFDLAVAKGAAIYGQGAIHYANAPEGEGSEDAGGAADGEDFAYSLGGAPTVVKNVLARGLGVEMIDRKTNEEVIVFLAHANDSIPMTASYRAGVHSDGQTALSADLYEQGGEVESERPEDNKEMASGEATTITGLTGLHRGDPIDITLDVAADGTVLLVVVEPQSGKRFEATAKVSVLSEEEVAKATAQVMGITTAS